MSRITLATLGVLTIVLLNTILIARGLLDAHPTKVTPFDNRSSIVEVNDPIHRFGKVYRTGGDRDVLSHEFLIHNKGADVLHIKEIKSGCGCTSATLSQDLAHPGDTISLAVKTDLKNIQGEFRQLITLVTDNLELSSIVLAVEGFATTLFQDQPAKIDFGRIKLDAQSEKQFTLRPMPGVKCSVSIPEASSDEISVSAKTINRNGLDEVDVLVALRPMSTEGLFSDSIRLLTGLAEAPEIVFPVTAYFGRNC